MNFHLYILYTFFKYNFPSTCTVNKNVSVVPSGELKAAEHDEPSEAQLRDKAEKMADSETIVTQPESSSGRVDFHLPSFSTDGGSLENENNRT